jgi:2-polyprenyl-3-methyl-5-hydroxy-6-metoxy-1,4-benzoquinol methylase/GNAT superfamily N-acetyltransferase
MEITYQIESELTNQKLTQEMSELYSNHYGFWGETSGRHGKRIKLSKEHISQWLRNEHSYIATARKNGTLVGYAIAVKKSKNKTNNNCIISWVTQLVVHQNYRKMGIGKTLLFSFWGFSNNYAWGIMSSNPYAIRALEKATYRRVDLAMMKKKEKIITKFGIENVSYLNSNTEFVINSKNSKVNTEFPSDISKVDEKLQNVSKNTPWILGEIEEGWEWFAFTFNEQEKVHLMLSEIEEMLSVSEDIAHKAYSRMLIEQDSHKWANHTKSEIDFIEQQCNLSKSMKMVDFGCGIGRHTIELYNRGYNVLGIDYSKELLQKAKEYHQGIFLQGDCREIELEAKYDLVLCLYDVIGSFSDEEQNIKILQNISSHLKTGGQCVLSVMNFERTKANMKYSFSLEQEPNKLLELTASTTMEQTGDIFNPDFYMIDTDTNIVYRKEQFSQGSGLPQELIVRDRRYTMTQIKKMCKNVGLKVNFSRHVSAGKWDEEKNPVEAKEILLVCEKVSG